VRCEVASAQLLKPVRQGRAAMLEDLKERYIINVPQDVKELLLRSFEVCSSVLCLSVCLYVLCVCVVCVCVRPSVNNENRF
jgi:hypothetical protein